MLCLPPAASIGLPAASHPASLPSAQGSATTDSRVAARCCTLLHADMGLRTGRALDSPKTPPNPPDGSSRKAPQAWTFLARSRPVAAPLSRNPR
ncbi:hypothetical protein AOQ84DRAFT_351205 [Glonium stellatum]|uniref:Uncharacterized protein n=1 Tax=Glonium stellatum TaxID=574774 RepID=A0A8E2JZ88_9PEZI|nr:hypothetical protein AOQ84DRAFT_351205 [Glonium stellatum]